MQNIFILYCPVEGITYTFSCASPEEKDTWLKIITEQIKKTLDDPRVDKQARGSALDMIKLREKVCLFVCFSVFCIYCFHLERNKCFF